MFSVTTPARSLADAAVSPAVTTALLDQAVAQALREGRVLEQDLWQRASGDPRGRLALALEAATGSGGTA